MPPADDVNVKLALDYIRRMANTAYVTSTEHVTIATIHKRPEYSGVSLARMMEWAKEDGWVAQRQEYLDNLQAKMTEKIGNEQVRDLMKVMERLKKVANMGLDQLIGTEDEMESALEFGNWERVAAVTLQFAERILIIQERLAQFVLPQRALEATTDPGAVQRPTIILNDRQTMAAARAAVQEMIAENIEDHNRRIEAARIIEGE